jgi:hypothetical protein
MAHVRARCSATCLLQAEGLSSCHLMQVLMEADCQGSRKTGCCSAAVGWDVVHFSTLLSCATGLCGTVGVSFVTRQTQLVHDVSNVRLCTIDQMCRCL